MSEKPKYMPVEMRTLVEVVRCEECKWRSEEWCNGWGWPARMIRPDDYCSQGERSE